MIVISNSNSQTLAPGQSMAFDICILHTGNSECYRNNTGVVNFAAKNAIYDVDFHGNIGATTAGDIAQLAIALDSAAMPETTMISTTAAAGDLNNVSAATYVKTCCCCGGGNAVTIVNTGTTTVTIDSNSVFRVKRVA